MSKYSEDIGSFMAKDDLDGLIRYVSVLPEIGSQSKSKILSIKGRLSKLESDRSVGILSQDEYSKERNQIRYGIIQLVTDLESKVEKQEEAKEKSKVLVSQIRKYSLLVAASILTLFIGNQIYQYISYRSNINLPNKYIGSTINRENIKELHAHLEEDSTYGNKEFNQSLSFLFSLAEDRAHYMQRREMDTAFWKSKLVSPAEFDNIVDDFLAKLEGEDMTFDKLFLELEYEKELRNVILLDSINYEYQKIDHYCHEIQEYIDSKLEIADKIKRYVKVDLTNVEINKSQKRLESKIRVGNGTGLTIYSIKALQYATDLRTGDTLTSLITQIDEPSGIETVYKTPMDRYSYWDQPHIYEPLKKYKDSEIYFQDKIVEVNLGGELFNLWYGYRPDNLPYDGDYLKNTNYSTPDVLDGDCPYMYYSNEKMKECREKIQSLISKAKKEKGYTYAYHRKQLSFEKE